MHRGKAGFTAPLLALLLALAASATACAQPGGAASGAGARAATAQESPDSLLAHASQSRQHGSASAPVTVVEISDFQCPYCRQFFSETYSRFDSAYVKTGKVRLIYINLPLPMHNQAFSAAETALCAGAQGKFWEMHDRLFATQAEWKDQADAMQRFGRLAVELHLDAARWRDCVDNDRTAALIVNDVMQASGAGVNGTPAFLVNGRMLNGAVPFEQLSAAVEAALAAPPAPAGAPSPAPPAAPAPPPAR